MIDERIVCSPNQFVERMLSEIEKLCLWARNESTGSALQRCTFKEIFDCADALCNPSDKNIEELREQTTNDLVWRIKIDWSIDT